jgi:hypothetical protein
MVDFSEGGSARVVLGSSPSLFLCCRRARGCIFRVEKADVESVGVLLRSKSVCKACCAAARHVLADWEWFTDTGPDMIYENMVAIHAPEIGEIRLPVHAAPQQDI